jgi:hypothetical protein
MISGKSRNNATSITPSLSCPSIEQDGDDMWDRIEELLPWPVATTQHFEYSVARSRLFQLGHR